MAIRKVKTAAAPPAAKATESAKPPAEVFFPHARYISIVGVHTSLLAFAALFLPRAAFADFASPTQARTRPKRDGVVMLTENPVRTLGWMCFGALVLQVWWGSWLREWTLDAIKSVETKEKPAEENAHDEEHTAKSARRLKHQELNSNNIKVDQSFSLRDMLLDLWLHRFAYGLPDR